MEFFLILAVIFVYFIPTIIAVSREHHNKAAISILNILLGWMLLGWIVALIWSVTAVNKPAQS